MGKTEAKNDFEWRQFISLGERIGEGDLGSDEKWMRAEYRRLSKILIPELREQDKELRKLKAKNRDEQMQKILLIKKCACGGILKQSRSGSKVAYCSVCNKRYVASNKRK